VVRRPFGLLLERFFPVGFLAGRAYADPYSPEEVQAFREQAQKDKKPFLYRNHRPTDPPEWDGTQPLRFKSNPDFYAHFTLGGPIADKVMGDLNINPETTDDFVIIKSDGFPTYNFAHVIDDYEMKITHVIRGQEFLSSMPGFLDLYNALNFDLPTFAHLPHILNEQGNKKLSKRDGAKDILDYISEGYLPEALRSFIATLGWNDGTEQEVFTTDELIQKFSLTQVGKSGAHFDEKRLNWVNGHFIRQKTVDELLELINGEGSRGYGVRNYWPKEAENFDETYKKQVLALVQERLKFFAELPELTRFFFVEPAPDMSLIDTNKQLKKIDKPRLKELLQQAQQSLEDSNFTPDDLQERLNRLLEQTGEKPAVLFGIIRIATTWAAASPPLNTSLAVLGKETSLSRIQTALEFI